MKTRRLPCRLTDIEIRERGQSLASLRQQYADVEAAKKAANDNFKDEISRLSREMDQLTTEINTKSQERDVEVTEEKDFEKKQAYIIRLDTSETVETRALTPQELQRPFLFDKDKSRLRKADEAAAL